MLELQAKHESFQILKSKSQTDVYKDVSLKHI